MTSTSAKREVEVCRSDGLHRRGIPQRGRGGGERRVRAPEFSRKYRRWRWVCGSKHSAVSIGQNAHEYKLAPDRAHGIMNGTVPQQ